MEKQKAIQVVQTLMKTYDVTLEDLIEAAGKGVSAKPQPQERRVVESSQGSVKSPALQMPATKSSAWWDQDEEIIDENEAAAYVAAAFPAPTLDSDDK